VGAGGKSKDENVGAGVAKAGNGAGPVGLILVGAPFGLSNAATVFTKTRAAFTGDDGLMDLLEELWRGLRVGRCHCIHNMWNQTLELRA